MSKIALITGVTGQDGAYLAEFLIGKGYVVHGLRRRTSSFNTGRVDHFFQDWHETDSRFFLHYGDMTDSSSLFRLMERVQPTEIYNLAAQSHVAVSFLEPEFTVDTDALGALRLLEAVRLLGLSNSVRYYQASSSEMFGKVKESPQNERTPFHPRSPYGVAKLFAYWITINYREAYGLFASNGILFNHESPTRGETFVTRKITRALCRIKLGLQSQLYLGNLNSKRDWGDARDYVAAQWLILQHSKPDDFVVATGEQHTVRDFVTVAAREIGIEICWRGEGVEEKGFDQFGRCLIRVEPRYFRPAEVDELLGDATKARQELGWSPSRTFTDLVADMMSSDMQLAEHERLSKAHGFCFPKMTDL